MSIRYCLLPIGYCTVLLVVNSGCLVVITRFCALSIRQCLLSIRGCLLSIRDCVLSVRACWLSIRNCNPARTSTRETEQPRTLARGPFQTRTKGYSNTYRVQGSTFLKMSQCDLTNLVRQRKVRYRKMSEHTFEYCTDRRLHFKLELQQDFPVFTPRRCGKNHSPYAIPNKKQRREAT